MLGRNGSGAFMASDMIAIADTTRDIIVMKDEKLAKLTPAVLNTMISLVQKSNRIIPISIGIWR